MAVSSKDIKEGTKIKFSYMKESGMAVEEGIVHKILDYGKKYGPRYNVSVNGTIFHIGLKHIMSIIGDQSGSNPEDRQANRSAVQAEDANR